MSHISPFKLPNSPPFSHLLLVDHLIRLAQDAQSLGMRAAGEQMVELAYKLLDQASAEIA